MLEAIIVVLIVLWLLGIFAIHITGWFVHLLIVAAVIIIIVRLVRGKKL